MRRGCTVPIGVISDIDVTGCRHPEAELLCARSLRVFGVALINTGGCFAHCSLCGEHAGRCLKHLAGFLPARRALLQREGATHLGLTNKNTLPFPNTKGRARARGVMPGTRALMTDLERDRIAGNTDESRKRRYETVSIVRRRLENLAKDGETLRENHPELYSEAKEAFTGND